MHYIRACPLIINSDLNVGTVTEQSSITETNGIILNQNPPAGDQVEKGSEVNLIVSSGLPRIIVPNVLNMPESEAKQTIISSNLLMGRILLLYNEFIPKGNIIEQYPVAGRSVLYGTIVNLVISRGPRPKVLVPNVIGLSKAEAEAVIVEAHLFVGQINYQISETVISGNVMDQYPKKGVSIVVGSAVDLVVAISKNPPIIISEAVTIANVNEKYCYHVKAEDPDGDILLYSLLDAPSKMTINSDNGLIEWSPEVTGSYNVIVQVTDNKGGFDSQSFTIEVSKISEEKDFTRPTVKINLSKSIIQTGKYVEITVFATDNVRVESIKLSINQKTYELDQSNQFHFYSDTPGKFVATATAKDPSGNIGVVNKSFTFISGNQNNDNIYPIVSILEPIRDSKLTSPTDIVGTVSDEHLTFYHLEYSLKDENIYIPFASGTTSISNGVLGKLDTTLMRNGIYEIKLTAEDSSGNMSIFKTIYQIDGELKVGNFTIGFNDLTINLTGLPIVISRNYDSRNKSKGEFGVGWTLDICDIKITQSCVMGKGWQQDEQIPENAGPFASKSYHLYPLFDHYIVVSYPDGRTDEFDMEITPFIRQYKPIQYVEIFFKPRDNTFSTLIPLTNTNLSLYGTGDVELWDEPLIPYNPKKFKLKTIEGIEYFLSQDFGIEKIIDLNGNSIEITDEGIIHSSGKSVKFFKDDQDRITSIEDPMGNVILYEYDDYGDLVSVTDQENIKTKFTYNSTHGLLDIIDPLGRKVARTEYDDAGRVTAIIDADGNRIEYTHNLGTRQEVVKDRRGHTTVFEYDEKGNVVKEVDPYGKETRYTYDSRGNKLSEITPLGKKTFRYDENNNVLEETDELGHSTFYTYNSKNQMLTTTDAMNRTYTTVYDENGRVHKTFDPLGNKTENQYDENGNLISTTNAKGFVTYYQYDRYGNMIAEINDSHQKTNYVYDHNGNMIKQTQYKTNGAGQQLEIVTEFIYDSNNRLIKTIDTAGNTTAIEYNAIGKKQADTDIDGNKTTYQYDSRGNIEKTFYPDGTVIENHYDVEGNLEYSIDVENRKTEYIYDKLNRLIKTTYPDLSTTSTQYSKTGLVAYQEDENNHRTYFNYDAKGRTTQIIDEMNNRTTFSYDECGNKTSMTDANGNTYRYVFDQLNRLIKTIYPDQTYSTTAYDSIGRKISETDQAGLTTKFEYDNFGRLTKVINALNNETTYGYDELGNKIWQKDANGNITKWEYDKLSRIEKYILPMGEFQTFSYFPNGNVKEKTDFNGNTITYEYYPNNNRLKKKIYPNNQSVIFEYYPSGQRKIVKDSNGTTHYEYDIKNRLTKVVNPDGTYLSYTYDTKGNRTTVTTPSGTTTYRFDALDRLKSVMDSEGNITSYTYDNVGNRKSIQYPNGTIASYVYDKLNRLTYLENAKIPGKILSSYTYTLEPSGNRISVLENTGRKVLYSYDPLYRLIKEEIHENDLSIREIRYKYDSVGNRLNKYDSSDGEISYEYNENDQLIRENKNSTVIEYQYDNNGNTIGKTDGSNSTDEYTYDYENRLISVKNHLNITIKYIYDADGIINRSIKNNRNVKYIVDKNRPYAQILEERYADKRNDVLYCYGFDLISQTINGKQSFFHFDAQRSTRMLTNSYADITDRYTYDSFGVLLSKLGTTTNKYMYTGEQYDSESNSYYLRARFYQQLLGRFINRDSYAAFSDPHKYIYCQNNPIINWDPSGHMTIGQTLMVVGIVNILASLGVASYNHFILGGDFSPDAVVYGISLTGTGSFTVFSGINPIIPFNLAGELSELINSPILKGIGAGFTVGAELVAHASLLELGKFIFAGPTYGLSPDISGFSLTVYQAIVWNLRNLEDYDGGFASAGFTIPILPYVGITQGMFKGSGNLMAYYIGETVQSGINKSISFSLTNYWGPFQKEINFKAIKPLLSFALPPFNFLLLTKAMKAQKVLK